MTEVAAAPTRAKVVEAIAKELARMAGLDPYSYLVDRHVWRTKIHDANRLVSIAEKEMGRSIDA